VRNAHSLSFVFLFTLPSVGQDQPETPPGDRASSTTEKTVQFASPELARLDVFIGPWSVTETHFNPRGEQIGAVKGTEEITWVLDHRAIRRAYSTATDSKTFKAAGMLTWNVAEKKYHGVWFDNVSTAGPTTVWGTWDDSTRTMLFEVTASSEDGPPVRYRVVERFADPQTRVATTYLVEGGNLVKRMEVEYKRAAPCPAKALSILGG